MRKLTPRAYQTSAVDQVLAYAAACPTGRCICVIPTRGGKTLVGALLVLVMAVRNGLHALWIVHREELLDDAVTHLTEVGIPRSTIGVIKAGRSSDPEARIQVASDATLDRRTARPVAHLVVTDECHRDTAPRRRRLRRYYPKAFMLGLTATPKPPPQRDLGEDFDTLIVVVQPSELIHDGFLACPTVYAPDKGDVPDLRGLRLLGGDYRVDDLEGLLLKRSILDAHVAEWARLSEGRRTITFPVSIAHSKALVARFVAAGVQASHLDGDLPSGDRRVLLQRLRTGAVAVVSSVGVLSEGINLPEVKCVLGVRPTRSLPLYIQQSMRCATPWNDVRPRILDGVGNVYRFGYPFEDRRWSLVNAESGALLDPGRAVVKRCPSCGAMMPAGVKVCAGCGRAFQAPTPVVHEGPVELHAVTPRSEAWLAEQKQLIAFGRARGFRDPESFASKVLAAKYEGEGATG